MKVSSPIFSTDTDAAESLCGVWVDEAGRAHLSVRRQDGSRGERAEEMSFFAWVGGNGEDKLPSADGVEAEKLKGDGVYSRLVTAGSREVYEEFLKEAKRGKVAVDAIRPLESQFLLQRRARLFAGMSFSQLKRCQLDIETDSADGSFSDASNADDRVLAIGLRFNGRERMLVLESQDDASEKKLLEELNAVLAEEDPDTVEGHNIFKFDLDYLRLRAKRLRVSCAWGRFGQVAAFRKSRLKVAEQWVDFPRCDLPGRTVVDTYLLVRLHDITTRELTSYGLKEVAVFFGVTTEESGRTYIAGSRIREAFRGDRKKFLAYLSDDLRETAGVADVLLPTFFEQLKFFPMLFQETILRGTTGKIDLLFLEEYFHARQACPAPGEIAPFEGGYTKSWSEGVYRCVLHFDVASLYPSLLLNIGKNPKNDSLGIFIGLLRELREYRLKYKQLARTAESEELRAEYSARQSSFKILINSFYGYLGFSGARFGDGNLAAEVTRQGREVLQLLISEFEKLGCRLLEADTDGIYVSSEKFFDEPEKLLRQVAGVLPEGIELEFDGHYDAMFCYKSKNYALRDGEKIVIRGSALRSRGIEPFLKKLTDALIRFLLGATDESPLVLIEKLRKDLAESKAPVELLAKSEVLGQNPEAYEVFIAGGGKPRRASAEAALLMNPRPRMGERVSYFILPKEKGRTSDWQRARPVELFDADKLPYDASYYSAKIDDWLERYAAFLEGAEEMRGKALGDGVRAVGGGGKEQGELF